MSYDLEKFEGISVWTRKGQRAPHKPLLLLIALGRLQQGENPQMPFVDIEPQLRKLLVEFGPTRQSYHPEYPFWALQQDGLWVLKSVQPIILRKGSSNPSKGELIKRHASGMLEPSNIEAFKSKPELVTGAAKQLLSAHFPESLHQDIANAVGINLNDSQASASRKARDPKFRKEVLIAYEYKCALCGFDMRIGSVTIGLEAAHIKWHQAGGADMPSNGLALCSIHHKLLDLGAYTILEDCRIQVSEHVHGGAGFNEILLSHHGKHLKPPQRRSQEPDILNLIWHQKEVFKTKGREFN